MTRFKGKSKVKWHTAIEQPPTDTGYYLVCLDNYYPRHSRYSIEQWLQGEQRWNTQHESNITYWAYLPDLPDGFTEEW